MAQVRPTDVTKSTESKRLSHKETVTKFESLLSSPEDRQEETPEPAAAVPPTAAEHPEPTAPAEPEAEETDAPTYTVKVNGQELTVDVNELRAGYQRDVDYRHKTEALAAQRRELETEAETVASERAQYQSTLAQLTDALQQLTGEPDWTKLHTELDPGEFLKRKADWEVQKASVDRLKAEQGRVQERVEQQALEARQKFLRGEQDKLKAALPEWGDPEKAQALSTALRTHLKTYGFSDAEIGQVVDSRAILLARDAMQWRNLKREPNRETQARLPSIKSARPGSPERPRPNAVQEKLMQRAEKSGRQRDAADAILAMLPNED